MKKYQVAVVVMLCLCTGLAFAEQRRPVIEDFTNEGCPPCLTIKDSMDAIFDTEYPDDITVIATHVWWPGSDKFWNWDDAYHPPGHAVAEDRTSLYGINAVPSFRFDGKTESISGLGGSGAQQYLDMRSVIETRLAANSPIRIDVTTHFRTADSVFIEGTFTVVDTLVNQNTSMALFVTETWKRGILPTAKYFNIHRLILPDHDGIQQVVNTGQVVPFSFKYAIDGEFNANRLVSNVIVWKPGTNRILQSWKGLVPSGVGIPTEGAPPVQMVLEQNKPNPFNPTTAIGYRIDRNSMVNLSIYDVSGRLVKTLVNDYQRANIYEIPWDGIDKDGKEVSSGVYYYRLDTDLASETKKMILIR